MVARFSSVSKVSTALVLVLTALLTVPHGAAVAAEGIEPTGVTEGVDGVVDDPAGPSVAGVAEHHDADDAVGAGDVVEGGQADGGAPGEPTPGPVELLSDSDIVGNPWDLSRSTDLWLSATLRRGETTERLIVDMFAARSGTSSFTAPTGTRIVQAGSVQGQVYQISADGRTATQSGTSMTGAGAVRPYVVLQVDADAPGGVVLDDGFYQLSGSRPVTVGIRISVAGVPVITAHPVSQTVLEGQTATFGAEVAAIPDATVQWQFSTDGGATFNYVPGGATSIPLTVHDVSLAMDGWQYRVRFTNLEGSAWSDSAVLTVSPVGFLEHPGDVTVNEGEVATHSVRIVPAEDAIFGWELSSDGGVTWRHSTVAPIEVRAGASDVQRLLVGVLDGVEHGVTALSDGRLNRAYLQYADDVVYSDTGLITVLPARVMVAEQPVSQSVLEGQSVMFSAAHGGTTFPVSAQWQFSTDGGATFNYVPGGATQQALTLESVTREMDGWQYRVRFTNAAGSTWSDAATLRVAFGIPAASGEAAPGETVELRVYDPEATRSGVMTITAPTGTRIESVRHNGPGSVAFETAEDGTIAISSRTSWGHASLSAWVTLRVSDDAVPGSVLDDGTAHVVDADVLVASGTLAVTVTGEIEVLEHPADVTVDVGATAELTAPVSGHGVTTQWQVSTDEGATWVDVDGETGTTLTLETTTPEMSRSWYRAVHTNSAGQVVTDHAVLLVRVAPHFVTHPQPEFFGVPGTLAFFAGWASDNIDGMPLTWEYSADGETWEPYEDGIFPGPPAGFNMLQLQPVLAEMDGVRFRAVAENHLGRAMSDPGLLTVSADPVISAHPADVRTLVGHDATFSASTPAVSPHRTQQWQERTAGGEWTDIPGATDPTFSAGPTTLEMDQRQYRVVFTNRHGSTASEPATLTVRAPVPATVTVTPAVRLVDQIR